MKATDRFPRSARLAMVLAWLLAGAAATMAQAPAGKALIADVIVPPGNYQMPTARIMGIIKTRAGAELDQNTLAEDVRNLYKTGSFGNVQVAQRNQPDGKVIVYFLLTGLPSTVQEIVYEGANHLGTDDLEQLTGLRKGTPLNPIANQAARLAILKKYQEKGRMFASVELVEGGKAGDTRVVFNITEGPVVKVYGTHFTGNSFVSEGRLRTQINTSRAFLHLLGGDFNPVIADADVIQLQKYYKTFGFQDATVSRELEWTEDHRGVYLVFHIHEGQRYRVAAVDVNGTKSFDQNKVMSVVHLKAGDWYDGNLVQADIHNIKDLYGYTGRDVSVEEKPTWAVTNPGEIAVNYEIHERQPAVVGQIIVVGNDVTKQNVILRQLPLYPGQVLTYPDIRVAENNLSRLNIFESSPEKGIRPTVEVLDPESDNPVKDILVHVEETRTGSLLFGVGVNSDAGLTGSIVLNERNFDILRPPTSLDDLLSGHAWRGAGQEFRLEAVPGTQLQRYTASWREPFLFDSPWSLGVSGYYYQRQFNEYNEDRLGMRITLGRKLNDYWSVASSLRVEEVGVHDVVAFAPPDYNDVVGDHLLVGLRGSVTRDTRDSYLRPTEGSMMELGYEQCFGDFTFPLATFEANKFFTVYQRADGSGRHVVALHSQLSWAGSNTPVYERYFAGGFRSIRGFEFRGVSPDIGGFKVGGDFMFLNSVEYQIPILANDQLYAVTFIDSGTVESSVELKDYRVTAGFGLRIVVPMLGPVPIALDFGFPIIKDSADRTQVFSFWLGFYH